MARNHTFNMRLSKEEAERIELIRSLSGEQLSGVPQNVSSLFRSLLKKEYEEINRKSRSQHIECATYTNYKLSFGLYQEQQEVAHDWRQKHDTEVHGQTESKERSAGAIGGSYTWKFTGTSLGPVVKLQCSCGEEVDLSDYSNW